MKIDIREELQTPSPRNLFEIYFEGYFRLPPIWDEYKAFETIARRYSKKGVLYNRFQKGYYCDSLESAQRFAERLRREGWEVNLTTIK